ncbi:fatty-acyl-CoA synthase [Burkholderiales bacterium]|nr:MAG: long-chain fatty acid--CoA ligase [Burkholderiales bacterium]CAG0961506.1 fatty-acyl-CoA synthase [Burkholderiales bacterium]
MYVIDWAAKGAANYPDKTALVDLATGRRVSYRQFNARASRFALYLRDTWGLRAGDRVAVLASNSSDYLEMLYGCAKLGAVMVCLNWRLSARENLAVLDDASPRALVFSAEFAAAAEELRTHRCIERTMSVAGSIEGLPEYEAALAGASGNALEMPCRGLGEVWYLLYTSGTTGKPKGVLQTYGMAHFNGVNAMHAAKLSRDDVLLSVLPFFHTGGLNLYANPLLQCGGTVVVMKQFDPLLTIELLQKSITVMFGVPAIYLFLSQQSTFAGADFSRVRSWACGGAPIPKSLLEQYLAKGVTICFGFGMTETGPTVFLTDEATARNKIGTVGRPVTYMLTQVVDVATRRSLGPNERGELLIKGPGVTPGYWNNAEATAKAFEDGWLCSGDIAYFDAEGDYYVVDRAKDMYISGGENVYPAEVENLLFQMPEVAEAAVIGFPDERWGEVGKAIIALKPGTALEAATVIAFCRERLAGYKVPRHVLFVDALPRNAAGKVEKPRLRSLYGSAG